MVALYDSIQSLDSKVWHGLEKLAYKHSKASRLLAFPLAIGTLVKDSLLAPALCIKSIALTAKSIKAYKINKSDEEKCRDIYMHPLAAIGFAILTPLSPLYGILHSITILFNVALHPFKLAKICAAKHDFALFVEKEDYKDKKPKELHPITKKEIFIHSATEKAFAQAIFDHFERQVSKAANNEEANNIRFLDEGSEEQIKSEILLKKEEFTKAYDIYTKISSALANEYEKQEDQKVRKEIWEAADGLIRAWEKFQKELIAAPTSQVASIDHMFSKSAMKDYLKPKV